MTAIVLLLFSTSAPIAGARWLRVAQREHYLAGEVTKFAARWWSTGTRNRLLLAAAVAATIASAWIPWLAVISIEVTTLGPLGLSMRGRTSHLAWTRRLKTVAAATCVSIGIIVTVAIILGTGLAAIAVAGLLMPLALDASLLVLAPFERKAASRFVKSAQRRLDRVGPMRVAITGSYGKTTIKGYVRHLAGTSKVIVASPASFNNTGGLSRTVNEMLAPDTEVFVAEMGTYGPGEIRDLCSWVRPDIAVLCNIGPVHLERFGSLDVIVTSKAEIFEGAATCILNIDAHGLTDIAASLRASGREVMTCSTSRSSSADITVTSHETSATVDISGFQHEVALPAQAAGENVACAIAVALSVGVTIETVVGLLPTIPGADHRCEVSVTPTGVTVVDDTYNSNPAGAAAALDALAAVETRRRVVVTPGMVELGKQQVPANADFGAAAGALANDVIIIGETNKAALTSGATRGGAAIHHVRTRNEAVEWVRANLGAGDAVLYENDLPDHYP
jgi:UDP-N-acetylmuramoyl-tripeptide--D-alanyl-D-alanine ligase